MFSSRSCHCSLPQVPSICSINRSQAILSPISRSFYFHRSDKTHVDTKMRLFEYSSRRIVVILVFIQNVASVPTYGVSNLFSRSLEPRDTDYEDFSWLRYWATLGDSYAAGIGAGSKIDKDCARYDRSYSYFMSIDDRLGTNQYREWQNLACSGATTEDIVANQIPSLANVQDVVSRTMNFTT